MCLVNSDINAEEIYCHTCGRIVSKDEAEIVCYAMGHNVETGEK